MQSCGNLPGNSTAIVQNDEMCSGLVLQEQAILVVQNPHDGEGQKKEKIIDFFDQQIKKAKKIIESHRDFLKNCSSMVVGEHRLKKSTLLTEYINEIALGKSEALSTHKLDVDLKEMEINDQRMECERNNKKFYQIPKNRQPTNTNNLKNREETISKALYGRQNRNTSVVIFYNEELKSVCFGLVTSMRKRVQMKSKNDVAVSVLARAKARISEFVRKLNDCLPSRMFGASVRLTMTDTDSAAYQVRFPVFLQRDKETK